MIEEEPAEPLVFRTAAKTRIGDSFVAFVYALGALILVPGAAVVCGAAVLTFKGPQWLAVLVGAVTLILVARMAWAGILEQIRFCMILHPEFLQVGEDISRIDLDYDAIDEVAVTDTGSARDVRLPGTFRRIHTGMSLAGEYGLIQITRSAAATPAHH